MELNIKRIVNNPINSNCFVIYKTGFSSCIIVDPGSKDNATLINFMKNENLVPDFIILTHEHCDHIWGVNELKSCYEDLQIISSQLCSDRIVDRKKNMSVFHDQVGFECNPCDVSVESIENLLLWKNIRIDFIYTPGHTDSSISILIGNVLFIGDTIIKDCKTVTKLPSGNKTSLLQTLDALRHSFFGQQIYVYSGHGESFWFDEIKQEILI
jgi:hydroxyacylglutathione hydrolase